MACALGVTVWERWKEKFQASKPADMACTLTVYSRLTNYQLPFTNYLSPFNDTDLHPLPVHWYHERA